MLNNLDSSLFFTILGGIGGILGAIFALGALLYVIFKHKFDNAVKHIETDSKDYYINQLKPLNTQPKKDRHTPYKRNLALTLNKIDSFFGKKLFSLQAFDRHLTFSFIYSFLLFYIVWFLGGRGDIGGIVILQNLDFFDRFLQTTILIIIGILIYLYFIYESNIDIFLTKKIKNLFLFQILKTFIYIIYSSVLLLIIILLKVEVGIFVGMIGIFIGVGLFLGILDTIKTLGKVGKVILLLSLTVLLTMVKFNKFSIALLLFFSILPIINALLDLISLAFTRYLSEKILNENRWYIILFHALLDVFMAFIFLSFYLF